jgi:hypothetical protein
LQDFSITSVEHFLFVETEAGNAFVHLQVGLGQAQQHPQNGHLGGRRGGGPARERRRERREAARQVIAAAEEAVAAEQVEKENLVAGEVTENVDGKLAEAGNVTEEDIFQIPQIDGTVDNDAHYELEIEAHDACTEDEIVEALEANFYGTLDDEKEENNELRYLIIQICTGERLLENENRKVMNYKIAVKENNTVRKIIESWNTRYNFDESAFENYNYETRSIRIKAVSRI